MQGADIIHDIRVVNTDDPYYLSKTPDKCHETAKREKKRKYLEACLKKSCHFTPFVASVDGLLGSKAEETLKRISRRPSKKWK